MIEADRDGIPANGGDRVKMKVRRARYLEPRSSTRSRGRGIRLQQLASSPDLEFRTRFECVAPLQYEATSVDSILQGVRISPSIGGEGRHIDLYEGLINNKLDKGGHFAAWEQPKFLSEEIRAGFRSLRK